MYFMFIFVMEEVSSSVFSGGDEALIGLFLLMPILAILFCIILGIVLASTCVLFQKAGYKWYEGLISGHNSVVFLKIAQKPIWWFFLVLLPFLASVIGALTAHEIVYAILVGGSLVFLFVLHIKILFSLSHLFGKSKKFAIGLILLPFIFLPILAFGDAEYKGVCSC